MKKLKQLAVLRLLKNNRYKVEGSKLYSLKTTGWIGLIPSKLPAGYKQYRLTNHKRGENKQVLIVYVHIATYLYHFGEYPEGWVIDHIDGNNLNNEPENLRAVEQKDNVNPYKAKQTWEAGGKIIKKIRGKEIAEIRRLNSLGASHVQIAKLLGLDRGSVMYTVQNIKMGRPLKYENYFK